MSLRCLRGIAYKPIQVRKQTLQKLRWRSICCVIHYSEQFLLPVFLIVPIESLHDSIGEDDQIISRIQAGPCYLVGNTLGNPQRDASHLQAFDRPGSSPQNRCIVSRINMHDWPVSELRKKRGREPGASLAVGTRVVVQAGDQLWQRRRAAAGKCP